jgi:hypothetical protein
MVNCLVGGSTIQKGWFEGGRMAGYPMALGVIQQSLNLVRAHRE